MPSPVIIGAADTEVGRLIIAMIELEEGAAGDDELRGANPERIAIGMEVESFFGPPAAEGGYLLPQARLRS